MIAERYLGSLNLHRLDPAEAEKMATTLLTALKLGYSLEVSLPVLKQGMDADYWIPLVSFKAITPATGGDEK